MKSENNDQSQEQETPNVEHMDTDADQQAVENEKALIENLINVPSHEKDIIRSFYQETVNRFVKDISKLKSKVEFVVVGHLVPTLPFYLEALDMIGDIAVVIAKGSKPEANTKEWLSEIEITRKIIYTAESFSDTFKKEAQDKFDKLNTEDRESRGLKDFKDAKNFSDIKNLKNKSKFGVREYLAVNGLSFIKKYTTPEKKVIIIDIGGYFAHTIKDISKIETNIIGYVEDTENGHQKYHASLEQVQSSIPSYKVVDLLKNIINYDQETKKNQEELDIFIQKISNAQEIIEDNRLSFNNSYKKVIPPLISVARSQIKDSEDYNVGKAITDATDHILRVSDYTHLAESKTILIIGYGKIGSAAAKVASEKTRGPVLVCEINPVRALKASAHSYKVVSIHEGLKQADIIICCTGNQCLDKEHLKDLKTNVYISSCTSRDDEFNENFFSELGNSIKGNPRNDNKKSDEKDQAQSKDDSDITRYIFSGKIINLLYNGNSVNFVEKAVHGYFIHGVLASLVVSAITVYDNALQGNQKNNIFPELKRGAFNDFNDLYDKNLDMHNVRSSFQSIISEILMHHKLRTEPVISNYRNSHNRYIPRENEHKELESKINNKDNNRVYIVGEKKSGKSQISEMFFLLNKAKYDIVWKFSKSISYNAQFRKLAEKINHKIKHEKLPAKEIGLTVEEVRTFLHEHSFPYLLVFEDIKKTSLELNEYIPQVSKRKKEHIIITGNQERLKNFDYNEENKILLKGFPELKLFKFLINDDAYWDANEDKFEPLTETFTAQLKRNLPAPSKTRTDTEINNLIQADLVGMINLAAFFISNQRSKNSSDFDLKTFIVIYKEVCARKKATMVW